MHESFWGSSTTYYDSSRFLAATEGKNNQKFDVFYIETYLKNDPSYGETDIKMHVIFFLSIKMIIFIV